MYDFHSPEKGWTKRVSYCEYRCFDTRANCYIFMLHMENEVSLRSGSRHDKHYLHVTIHTYNHTLEEIHLESFRIKKITTKNK